MFLAHSGWQWHCGTMIWPFCKLMWCQYKSYCPMPLIISLETSEDVADNDFNDLRQSKLHLQKKIDKYIKYWNKVHLLSASRGGGAAAQGGGASIESSGKLRPWLWGSLQGSVCKCWVKVQLRGYPKIDWAQKVTLQNVFYTPVVILYFHPLLQDPQS